ncbi:MAG: nucleotidyltransferase domain-containing protein [Candidatus Korarchaeum sp.]
MPEGSSVPEELREVVRRIRERYDTVAVILFGSRARGDHMPWSDYDILVIADFGEGYLDRIGALIELLGDLRIAVEPHPYTLEEALLLLRKGNPTLVDAISEGLVLHRDERFSLIEEAYEDLVRRGMRRTDVSLVIPPEGIVPERS